VPEEFKPGCQRPPVAKKKIEEKSNADGVHTKEEMPNMVKVGKPAPDFTAAGFLQGKFMNFKLSEYLGKWVLVCFYPGDFTFV
jgi:peroxiredoxin (alkyl hydroperoxide reductase subunit C)